MEQRTFHGNIAPADLAQALVARFSAGDFQVRQLGRGDNLIVQVATPALRRSGGPTAITIHLSQVEDGGARAAGGRRSGSEPPPAWARLPSGAAAAANPTLPVG
jgi:hypothetical protein